MIDYQDIIDDVAAQLGIEVPTLNTDQALLPSPTALAGANVDKWDIVIKDGILAPDAIFAIAHELRHLWQYKNGWDLAEVKDADISDKEEYNLQEHEVDANAFAYNYMLKFGLRPLFNGMSERVKNAIYKRAEEIK